MPLCDTSLPDEIMAGLDFQATLSFPQYPATTWGLNAVIRGPMAINLTASPDSTDATAFLLSAPGATTETWTPGKYWYSLRATQGSAIMEAGSGEFTVLQDLASVTGAYDGRSQDEIALAAIDAVIAKRATMDQQRYKINERELWRTPMSDLLNLRAYYSHRVARARAKARGCSRFGRPIIVKFRP
jgi:hypothetical protein